MALVKVSDFLTEVKNLVQDVDAVRYSAERYFTGLNVALSEAYRVRPDFFRSQPWNTIPQYSTGDENDVLIWPAMYKQALLLYMTGYLELTDSEGNEDARAAALLQSFVANLKGN